MEIISDSNSQACSMTLIMYTYCIFARASVCHMSDHWKIILLSKHKNMHAKTESCSINHGLICFINAILHVYIHNHAQSHLYDRHVIIVTRYINRRYNKHVGNDTHVLDNNRTNNNINVCVGNATQRKHYVHW